ncbi:MAG: hypothetical protein KAZ45_01530 [Arenimonas sp.]|nr:hypothetical protein [Arenimonas sp.]
MMNAKQLALAALLAAIPLAGNAANPKPPAGPPMGKEELRRCVAMDDQLRSHTHQYNAEVKLNNALVKKQQEMLKALDEMRIVLDAGDNSKIGDYNAMVEEYNLLAEKQDVHKNQMSLIAVEQSQTSTEYNAKCANRTFRQQDMAEIKGIKKK